MAGDLQLLATVERDAAAVGLLRAVELDRVPLVRVGHSVGVGQGDPDFAVHARVRERLVVGTVALVREVSPRDSIHELVVQGLTRSRVEQSTISECVIVLVVTDLGRSRGALIERGSPSQQSRGGSDDEGSCVLHGGYGMDGECGL